MFGGRLGGVGGLGVGCVEGGLGGGWGVHCFGLGEGSGRCGEEKVGKLREGGRRRERMKVEKRVICE